MSASTESTAPAVRRFWPYDEVSTVSVDAGAGRFALRAPWISAEFVAPTEAARVFLNRISAGGLTVNDAPVLTSLLSAFSSLPVAYILPRANWDTGLDHHSVRDRGWLSGSISDRLYEIAGQVEAAVAFKRMADAFAFCRSWEWDTSAAVTMSRSDGGCDPEALFSIARRFHLLDSVERNRTSELYRLVEARVNDQGAFQNACALIVRQNHFVTSRCERSLRPALLLAQSAEDKVQEFMDEERGHDRILARALTTLTGEHPERISALAPTQALMAFFEWAAGRNFLAFAMIVDMFERSSYQERDPLASLLLKGGFVEAARHLDSHREINDAGGHENVALGFLERMGPVTEDYATESLRIAEVATALMHSISGDLINAVG